MKNEKKLLIVTSLICLLPIVAGAILYPRLPATMATHWNFNGEADGFMSRPFAVFGIPGILLAANLLMPWALRADPKHENMSAALKMLVCWTCPVISVLCGGLMLALNLGYDVRIEFVVPVFMGVVFIVIGNFLPKTKQSYTMGIKLPWTLNSEENWNRTHRLAGFLWVLGGVFFIAMSFFGWSLAAFLIPLAVMVLVPTGYSYLLYRKGI